MRSFLNLRVLFTIAACMVLLSEAIPQGTEDGENALFYPSSKPLTRWWWFASEIEKEDVISQLDWVKENGFGGVEIAWVYPLNKYDYMTGRDTNYVPRQEWLSREWSDIVAFTKAYCDKQGLTCDYTFGTGWPFGDTRVPFADATKVYGEHPDDEHKKTYHAVSWEFPRRGYIMDHLDKDSFLRYAARMADALDEGFKGKPSGIFVDSWEVETRKLWTRGFDREFRERYGYDIRDYMDNIYDKGNAHEHYDYIKLISEYVLNGFYIPFTEVSHQIGSFSRAQVMGAPVDVITAYAITDVPESEAMLYEPPYSRIVASAAALGERREITAETFTCTYGFPRRRPDGIPIDNRFRGEELASDLKLVADAMFANGVNQVIWHGMPFNKAGIDTARFYATVHVGRTGKLAAEIKTFNAYMENISSIMKEGVTYSDLAIYLPLEDAWMGQEMDDPDPQMPWAWGDYEMRYVRIPEEIKGYQPLWINQYFLEKAILEDGRIKVGDVSFSSLYLDVEYIDSEALDIILTLAKRGFPVCVKQIPNEPGHNKTADYQSRIRELLALPNVSKEFSGVIKTKPILGGDDLPDFWVRDTGDEAYIFIANPKAQNLSLPLEYGQSNTEETVVKMVSVTYNNKTSEVNLSFKPNQSLMLRVSKEGRVDFMDITYNPGINIE